MQCATLYARLCASLCKILCQIIITLCCAVNWLWGGAGDGVVEERGWEVVDLAVERAVKLVNGRSALGKDPQGGWPEHQPHHTGFDSLMQSAKPYSKQTFCPDAKINTYFQTLLKEIKKRLTWLLLHTFCFQSRSAETFSDLCSFSASPL